MNDAVSPAQLKKIMLRLQQEYLEQMKSHIADFQGIEQRMRDGTLPNEDLQRLYRLSHDFAGSGSTFGFPDISRTARSLHLTLKAVLDVSAGTGGAPSTAALSHLRDFVKALEAAQAKTPEEAAEGIVLPETPEAAPARGSSDIYFLAGRPQDVETLVRQISHFGYNIIVNAPPNAIRAALGDGAAKALVAFCDMAPADITLLQSVYGETARRSGFGVPLIVVSPNGDFDTRLAAARIGAQGFFAKEADALKLTERIEQLSYKFSEPPRYNIMIVDDDKMLTEFYNHTLTRTGMSVMTLTQPKEALAALDSQQVDLLLVDFSMPGCNGQELAAVIRQHERHISLPIVFISSYEDLHKAIVDTGLGIDDFLVKPFTADKLFSVVRNRAQRAAELRAFMTRDSFTGLYNHAYFNELLGNELARVRRGKHEASYAMLDLDHFKSINDTHGHAAGDAVIKGMARMLKQQLRRSDIVGRCGGEEFGVILPECPLPRAREILEKIRKSFEETVHTFGAIERTVTFSAGLVRVNPGDDLDHLMKVADAALYKAKKAGRNRIEVFGG